jgi:L,D-transpeptidase catalytic domain/Sel1 repeat
MHVNLMRTFITLLVLMQFAACATSQLSGDSAGGSEPRRLVVSVHDQQMILLEGGKPIARYMISSAKNGVGEGINSGRTPRGRHAIAEKIGRGAAIGTVFEDRIPTNEIVAVNTPGQTPIVTRILRMRGLEDRNQSTFDRFIYLHGSPMENLLGKPVSGGNIRMRSAEIVDLFERVEVGTEISIFEEPMEAALVLLAQSDAKLAALQKAAESGAVSAYSQLCYGQLYGAGGIPINEVSALGWCSSAAVKNDPNAITLLGEIYERGKGVAVDLAAARQFYERAAMLGHPYAQFMAAQMYRAGIGGTADEALANRYLELSAKQGLPAAIKLTQPTP